MGIISSSGLKNIILNKYTEEEYFIMIFGNQECRMNGNVDEKYLIIIKMKYCKIDIIENDFDKSKNEMLLSSNKLINCISYNNLIRLFNLTMTFSSAILGCIFAFGIIRWQQCFGPES